MSQEELGCCGAYCKTCRVFHDSLCRGCKLGYSTGERDINKAKCKIKVCCLEHHHQSCADCNTFLECETLLQFFSKKEYKYKKYKAALDFIIANGYDRFIEIADQWKMQYGKYC